MTAIAKFRHADIPAPAFVPDVWATRGEGAAFRQIVDQRRAALDGVEPAFRFAQHRHAIDQLRRIGMRRGGQYFVGRARFDNAPRIHDGHPVADG